jgi:hypothetical protein
MRVRTTRGSGQIGYRSTRRRHDFGHPLRVVAVLVLAAAAAVACIAFPPASTLAPPDALPADFSLR